MSQKFVGSLEEEKDLSALLAGQKHHCVLLY